MRHSTLIVSWQYTTISISVILVVGGSESVITGIRPTYTIIKVAIFPILSLKSGPWTKVNRVRIVISTRGINMVSESIMGYL